MPGNCKSELGSAERDELWMLKSRAWPLGSNIIFVGRVRSCFTNMAQFTMRSNMGLQRTRAAVENLTR